MFYIEMLRAEMLCWDNEEAAAESSQEETPTAGTTQNPATGKTFTQEEVNKFVAERNKALKTKFETMEKSYETLLQQQNLTNDQRAKLEAELDQVRQEMMSKEQRLEQEKKKAQMKYEQDLAKTREEANKYKTLFEQSTIERAITDASMKHDAFSPKQFIAHLAPQSVIVEEVDAQGNLTGRLVPRVKWQSVDEHGQIHVSQLTPDEAVEKMKDNVVEFGNLFRTNVASGIGAGTAPGQSSSAGQINHKKISTEEYMKLANDPEARRRMGLSR